MKIFARLKILVVLCSLAVSLLSSCNANDKTAQSSPTVTDTKISTPTVAATPAYSKERFLQGEKIFKSVIKKYNFVPQKPIVNGWCKDVIVPMPINEWKKLSGQDKVNVSLFAENVILGIRANPEKYIDMPKSAPLYDACFENASKMCDTCWSVEVGSVATIDGETNLGADSDRVVDGKDVVAFRKAQEK